MTYRATGTDRDSYIAGRRHAPNNVHDINARRDNLPENVFRYLQEQVSREQFEVYTYENQRAANQLQVGKRGRRILHDNGVEHEDSILSQVEMQAQRHQQLVALYAKEAALWEEELAAKGYAIEKN